MIALGDLMCKYVHMPHQRARYAENQVKKMATFWPIVGLLGLRQIGKSTLLRDRLGISEYLTFDEPSVRDEAEKSPTAFLSRFKNNPTVLDEVQKVPNIFDSLKAIVDQKKLPGRWYLTGSVAFSNKVGIRESLTGRIGLLHLYPMSLAEVQKKDFLGNATDPKLYGPYSWYSGKQSSCRFSFEDIAAQMNLGGLPVPAFIRDEQMRTHYWNNWLDTTLNRDAQKAFGKGYDPDYCFALIRMLAQALPLGEYPSLSFVSGDKRKAKRYIAALQDIFFLRRFSCHERGVGNDHWIFGDSGLAYHLSTEKNGSGIMLSLIRHMVLNEIFCFCEYRGEPLPKIFYKSARGSMVDLVWKQIPIRIIVQKAGKLGEGGYAERALQGAMKKLGVNQGLLVAPLNQIVIPKKGIGIVPWSFWS